MGPSLGLSFFGALHWGFSGVPNRSAGLVRTWLPLRRNSGLQKNSGINSFTSDMLCCPDEAHERARERERERERGG